MATYEAKVKYTDIRVITIEAESDEEADAKWKAGDFDEDTVDFYSDRLLEPLRRISS